MQLFSRILLQVLSSFHLFPFLFQISDSFDLKYVREQVKVTGCCFTWGWPCFKFKRSLCIDVYFYLLQNRFCCLLAGLHRGTRNNAYQKGRICSEDLFWRLHWQVSSMTSMGVVTFSNFWIFIFQFLDIYISIFGYLYFNFWYLDQFI